MVVAALGTVLAAGYLLWLFQRTAFGTPKRRSSATTHIHDVHVTSGWRGRRARAIVVLGIFPNLVFKLTDDAVTPARQHGASVEPVRLR